MQSEVYLTYHMTDPDDFYAKEDAWAVPANPIIEGSLSIERTAEVPPTYLLLQLPGETGHEFVLTRPFTPRARNNMIALMVARSDPEHYGEFVTFEFPRGMQVPGPIQVDNAINQDVEIISDTHVASPRGFDRSTSVRSSILPVEDSILYVQPLFVTAENVGIPELKRVVLAAGRGRRHGGDVRGSARDAVRCRARARDPRTRTDPVARSLEPEPTSDARPADRARRAASTNKHSKLSRTATSRPTAA